jgi:hypothetical protein
MPDTYDADIVRIRIRTPSVAKSPACLPAGNMPDHESTRIKRSLC